MNATILNKQLWNNITKLKLYIEGDKDAKFLLEKNPFDDVEEEKAAAAKNVYFITGRVHPTSGIYQESGFQIEMKLTSDYPNSPPVVRILTPVYHPNIEKDGTFCHQLLNNGSRWRRGTNLLNIIKILVQYMNEPDPDYAAYYDIGKEYLENREEFERKAHEMTRAHYIY